MGIWSYDNGYVDEKQGRISGDMGSGYALSYDEHKEPLTELIVIHLD